MIRGLRKLLITGGLLTVVSLSTACGSADPLLEELDKRHQDRPVVSLREVYGQEWEQFGLACPSIPSDVTASSLGVPPEKLPDYAGSDHLNAIVRWNSETVEVSEFPVQQVRLCNAESPWTPEISDPMVVFEKNPDGGWTLQ